MWKWFLAFMHLNNKVVCEMSRGLGDYDYHDYRDCECRQPAHFELHHCKRCLKPFRI